MIMGFIKRQLLKVIKWDDPSTDVIVYRYPMQDRDEIMNGCQLIVSESQTAMLVSGGQIADVYGPGTHKLTTSNMPIITKLSSWKYGFDSPFKAVVYYVNTKQFINLKWGTASRVPMRDADFGMLRVGGRGTYSFKVKDAPIFMREIFGTIQKYTTNELKEYFKSIIVTGFSNSLGLANIPALDLPGKYRELAETMKESLIPDFEKIGIEVISLYVENISLPEEVENAMDQRTSVGVMGDKMAAFTQYQTAQAIRDAANNEGGGMASAGVGMGAGVIMGQAMVQGLNNNIQSSQPQTVPSENTVVAGACGNCGKSLIAGAKFCSHCGTAVPQQQFCSHCGAKALTGAKFCSNCGKQL